MLTLTRDEVRELTGAARKEAQRRELTIMGIPHTVRSDGWPVVDRQAYHQAMGAESEPQEVGSLNWEAM